MKRDATVLHSTTFLTHGAFAMRLRPYKVFFGVLEKYYDFVKYFSFTVP
jgi:hypothetical protein